ncbi:unnamed protein product, partial [Prorocentrum cordatum]
GTNIQVSRHRMGKSCRSGVRRVPPHTEEGTASTAELGGAAARLDIPDKQGSADYASGSRHKGFFWALLSGLSEPVGALIGYLIIKASGEDMSQTVYGVLFGIVAGMMIMIVLLELMPTALRYDPADRYVTNSMVMGMVVMATSLVLFTV